MAASRDLKTDAQNAGAVKVHALGCTLAELRPPGGCNVCLSYAEEAHYAQTGNPCYFGETIGRVANRIAGGALRLNGRVCGLPLNGDGGRNCLHGGVEGWGKRVWDGPRADRRLDGRGVERDAARYTLTSRDGDEGFPGAVLASAWWFVYHEDDGRTLVAEVEYEAQMTPQQEKGVDETIVSMTNHAYFNLSPVMDGVAPTLSGTMITIPTTVHLELQPHDNIPTGKLIELAKHAGLQAGQEARLGDTSPQLDHCFVLNDAPSTVPLDTRQGPMRECARLSHPETGLCLSVATTEPAFQVYTGEGIISAHATDNYGPRAGIAIEPGRYTDACSREGWKGMVTLKRGDVWGSRIRYSTWKEPLPGLS